MLTWENDLRRKGVAGEIVKHEKFDLRVSDNIFSARTKNFPIHVNNRLIYPNIEKKYIGEVIERRTNQLIYIIFYDDKNFIKNDLEQYIESMVDHTYSNTIKNIKNIKYTRHKDLLEKLSNDVMNAENNKMYYVKGFMYKNKLKEYDKRVIEQHLNQHNFIVDKNSDIIRWRY